MKTGNAVAVAALGCVMLAGNPSRGAAQALSSEKAYAVIPASSGVEPPASSAIGPGDQLAVNVFQEPDFSLPKVQVDETGLIHLPLIGEVAASGKTASALAQQIAARLGERYIRHPRVTVSVTERALQTVTVEGQVTEPGVFAIGRDATLLTALARAKSPTKVARLDQVVLFRTLEGQRTGAVFDLREIRAGRAPDPRVHGGDVIVVGFSSLKGAFRDVLQAVPVLGVFSAF